MGIGTQIARGTGWGFPSLSHLYRLDVDYQDQRNAWRRWSLWFFFWAWSLWLMTPCGTSITDMISGHYQGPSWRAVRSAILPNICPPSLSLRRKHWDLISHWTKACLLCWPFMVHDLVESPTWCRSELFSVGHLKQVYMDIQEGWAIISSLSQWTIIHPINDQHTSFDFFAPSSVWSISDCSH